MNVAPPLHKPFTLGPDTAKSSAQPIEVSGVTSFGRVSHYERKGLYRLEDVFAHINEDPSVYVLFDSDPIRMSSERYALFNQNVVCVRCGVSGLYFAKERAIYVDRNTGRFWPTSHHFHFNLYGRNRHGHEVMLTKDHILPRAHGGKDELANYQSLCSPCNSRKRDRLPGETDKQYAERRAMTKRIERERNALHTRGIWASGAAL